MKIVFMGTPDFAVASLRILHESAYDICGVITATDKLYGRGKKQLYESPVKKYARAHNLTILQPKNLKNKDFVTELKSLNADLQIVVAFRMLPKVVWDMPSHGTYNLHGSLLPKYRGAAPINWAIIKGETWTGLTTFKLKHEIDTGSILQRKAVPIYSSDSLKEVHDRMQNTGATLVLESVKQIENKKSSLQTQEETKVTHAPKLFHSDLNINFKQTSNNIYNYIRGLSPFPAAWTIFEGKKIKVFQAHYKLDDHHRGMGQFKTDYSKYLKYATLDGWIYLTEVQLEGRKKMKLEEMMRGYNSTKISKNKKSL